MSRKACIELASRTVALFLVFWSLQWFAMIPARFHSVLHYRTIYPRTAQQDYLYTNDFLLLLTYITISAGLFLGAIWVGRCGPAVQRFLSPSED